MQLPLALQGLSDDFRQRLVRHNTFYRISQLDGRISDVSQRLADDVRDFASTASEIIAEVLKPLIELMLFCVKLRALVGSGATGALLAYLGFGALAIRLSLPNFQRMVAREAEANGRYRAVHSRVRAHCESIAFFGGDEREKAVVDAEFKNVHRLALHRLTTSLGFGLVNQAIVREAPMLVQWVLRNEYVLLSSAVALTSRKASLRLLQVWQAVWVGRHRGCRPRANTERQHALYLRVCHVCVRATHGTREPFDSHPTLPSSSSRPRHTLRVRCCSSGARTARHSLIFVTPHWHQQVLIRLPQQTARIPRAILELFRPY